MPMDSFENRFVFQNYSETYVGITNCSVVRKTQKQCENI